MEFMAFLAENKINLNGLVFLWQYKILVKRQQKQCLTDLERVP